MSIIKRFINFSEIQTKIASVLPFFTALAYCFYLKSPINMRSTVLFFLGMVIFDMTVTMINNYIDTISLRRGNSDNYRGEIGPEFFSRGVCLALIFIAILLVMGVGLYLSWLHGLAFLLAGMYCFVIGVGYTFGPMPISRSPFGEFFSGTTMGFVIPFLVMEINTTGFIKFALENWQASGAVITLDLFGLLKLALVCMPLILCVANVMLANNICDLEADRDRRYTMPRHIGIKNALRVFSGLYALLYFAIITACILRVLPWFCLFVLLTIIPVYRNIKRFNNKQIKKETFIISVKNFIIIVIPYAVCILAGGMTNF